MAGWFLSYNSQDLALMQRLEAALWRREPETKIFFAPTSLRAGGFWLPELAKGIAEATAFVLLVGKRGLGPWQVIEYYEALDRRVNQHDFPVILVLLEGQPAPGLPFLRQLHWIVSADPASEQTIGLITDAAAGGDTPPGELWRHTAPYRGLAAMTEADSDFFFGRGREIVEVIRTLEATPEKLPVLLGNSGVGKSSLARAGVLAALARQNWPETAEAAGAWPRGFGESRTWCVLTLKPGTEPVRTLVEAFIRTWQFDPTDPRRDTRLNEWIESLIEERSALRSLLSATEERFQEQGRSKPPAFMLYIDQGEELYVRADPRQGRCFSKIVAEGLSDPRLRALMSMRADFFGELQKDEPLDGVSRKIEVKPLREVQLREVVSKPAALLGARFETAHLAADIAQRTAEESSKNAGTLPLLSYLLDDMWKSKDPKWDGVLRLPATAIALGRVLVDRANAFMAEHPNSEDRLRRIFTLKLATVRESGEPTRRRALRQEFSDEEWRLVSELADYPNRLLVTAGSEADETYAEVAHEAIFRRWDKLREWIASEREFLAWRSGLETARRAWQATPEATKAGALLMGAALSSAQSWFLTRAEDLPAPNREFIALSVAREKSAQAQARRLRATLYLLLVGAIVGLVGWINQATIAEKWRYWTVTYPYMCANRPYVLTMAKEQALKPGSNPFKECAQDCPEMMVVPAGRYTMGDPTNIRQRQHAVTFANPFAVSRYEVTVADWDACVKGGGCNDYKPNKFGLAGATADAKKMPVLNVNWDDATAYAAWLTRVTGKTYRLLFEAEYEYAARAGTTTAYPWRSDDIGKNNAQCIGCGSQWDNDNKRPVPVGSFAPNGFGLYDMVGNVWEWTEDCWHADYADAPKDGLPWLKENGGDCKSRVARGGSWNSPPGGLRSSNRGRFTVDTRNDNLGFRVARKLTR
jgi:formylglycine-generating enzyme required for sulfatase activity